MNNLYELTLIVNRIKTRRIEIIGKERTKYGKLTKKLYDGIVSGKYKTDREAAIDLYGPEFKPNNYTRLKIILTEKLINTLFFIDVSDYNFTDIQKALIECEKLRTAVKILLSRSARGVALKLGEKIVRKSMKYEFTDITLEIARYLRRHYRTFSPHPEKEKLYDQIVKHYFKVLEAEIEVENSYELIIKEFFSKNKFHNSELVINDNIEVMNKFFPKYKSHKLGLIYYMSLIKKHEYSKDYQKVAETCHEALDYFTSKNELAPKHIVSNFHGRLLSTCVPLKQFSKGKSIAEDLLQNMNNGSINWYLALDDYFLLSLHTRNYSKAISLYNLSINNTRFQLLPNDFQEIWRVYEAYLEYLRIIGEIQSPSEKPFRVGKFMNNVPIFSKDKKGVNIAIIIIQILFLIAQGKEYKVIDKVEALRTYVHTHLRNDDSLRSNCFIKMLMGMVKANFHKNGTIRKTQTLHKKLKSTPILEKSQTQFVEIIPYEQLWEMSLTQLHNRAF